MLSNASELIIPSLLLTHIRHEMFCVKLQLSLSKITARAVSDHPAFQGNSPANYFSG
jgi:hypothetical protein